MTRVDATRTGYFTARYVSALDDSGQPFALWVPRTYTARKKYPLLVALHGMDADHRMIPEECFRIPERGFSEEVVLLSPFGRGDISFRGPGEADVWDTMNWVKARYRIDARRQYLTGLSMGGYATWRLACAYPQQWAALAPICGGGKVAALKALKTIPVWCVHGERDPLVPVENSRALIAELRRLNRERSDASRENSPHPDPLPLSDEGRGKRRSIPVVSPSPLPGERAGVRGSHELRRRPEYFFRYDELAGWGHNAWEWLYDPNRESDSLVKWFLQFRKTRAPAPVRRPARRGAFRDLFNERVILSYPARTALPRESDLLRSEAERLARLSFGDFVMRSGKLIVKTDEELTATDLAQANQLMIGRTDNHCWLKHMRRRLLAKHFRGKLQVSEETWLGKSLLAVTCQPSPWNARRLLGVITYQQFHQLRGFADELCENIARPKMVNVYDTLQRRFIFQR